MDGSEDSRIREPTEPRIVQWARLVRLLYDLLYPVVLTAALVGVIPVLVVRPELRDPQIMAMIGGGLMALGGIGLRSRRGP